MSSGIFNYLTNESTIYGLLFLAVAVMGLIEILSPEHSIGKKIIFGSICVVSGVMSVVRFAIELLT